MSDRRRHPPEGDTKPEPSRDRSLPPPPRMRVVSKGLFGERELTPDELKKMNIDVTTR